jgi:hypothetical protein
MTEAEIEKVAKRASELVLDSIDGQITEPRYGPNLPRHRAVSRS